LYTTWAGSWFISLDKPSRQVRIPDFADLYPVPEEVAFRISSTVEFGGATYALARSVPYIGMPMTRICRLATTEDRWSIFDNTLDEPTLSRIQSLAATKSALVCGGASGCLTTVAGEVSWKRIRSLHEGDPWEAYTVSENGIVAFRRYDSTNFEMCEIGIPDLNVTSRVHLNGVLRRPPNTIKFFRDTLFVGNSNGWSIFDTETKVSWMPDSVPIRMLLYAVDSDGGIVWGTDGRFIHAWSVRGEYLGKTQESVPGPIGRLLPTSNSTVVFVDLSGSVAATSITKTGFLTTTIFQPSDARYMSFPKSLDNNIRILLADASQMIPSIVKIDIEAPYNPIQTDIEPVPIPEGEGLYCTDEFVFVRRGDSTVTQYFHSKSQLVRPFLMLGATNRHTVQILGQYKNWVVSTVGPFRLGYFDYKSATSVDQDYVQHVFFKKIFPNPATKTISAEIGLLPTADRQSITCTLYSLRGDLAISIQEFEASALDKFSVTAKADVSGLPPGAYVLVISNRGYRESKLVQIVR
jgi:hypothetical protein